MLLASGFISCNKKRKSLIHGNSRAGFSWEVEVSSELGWMDLNEFHGGERKLQFIFLLSLLFPPQFFFQVPFLFTFSCNSSEFSHIYSFMQSPQQDIENLSSPKILVLLLCNHIPPTLISGNHSLFLITIIFFQEHPCLVPSLRGKSFP